MSSLSLGCKPGQTVDGWRNGGAREPIEYQVRTRERSSRPAVS
jgi:hypothetical protein